MTEEVIFKNYRKLPLFYWSEIKFIFKDKENYGDLLSKYLIEKISGKKIKFIQPKKQPFLKFNKRNLLAIGSIIHHASKDSIVWGSGIIDFNQQIAEADFRAVRGPRTRDYLLSLGYSCPEIYGDPAIFLPDYYSPRIEKKYSLGVIPHYHDLELAKEIFSGWEGVKVIDLLTLDIEATTREILECEKIISTSLHGIIVAHAYQIPGIWVKMSDKIFGNDIKYVDYLESVSLEIYKPLFITQKIKRSEITSLFTSLPYLPSLKVLGELKERLMNAKPF